MKLLTKIQTYDVSLEGTPCNPTEYNCSISVLTSTGAYDYLQALQRVYQLIADVESLENTANAIISEAENVNIDISGTIVTITDRNGNKKSIDLRYGSGISDVSLSGKFYGRKKGEWVEISTINGQTLDSGSDIIIYNHWFGTQEQYDTLSDEEKQNKYTLFHIQKQPDWNETDETSLSYIKNKPHILDAMVGTDEDLILYYK